MKRIIVAFLLLAVAAAAWFSSPALLGGSDTPAEELLYGNVDIRELSLAFRQSGRLAAVQVEEGDRVEAGDLVATLDEEPFREALAVAEAQVDLARSRLERLERGARPQEIEQARAAVREAEARLSAAEKEHERKLGLLDTGASSEREVERAREQRETSAARLEAAGESLALLEAGSRREDVAAGRAELRLAEARLAQAETALADARLTAPSAGTILVRAREPGAVIAAGAPVATLSLTRPVVVRAYVPEPMLGHASPGTPVEITTDGSHRRYRGRVGFVSPRAEFTPKTVETPELRTDLVYRLRILVEGEAEGLLQGMPVTVHLDPQPDAAAEAADGGR